MELPEVEELKRLLEEFDPLEGLEILGGAKYVLAQYPRASTSETEFAEKARKVAELLRAIPCEDRDNICNILQHGFYTELKYNIYTELNQEFKQDQG